MVILTKRYYLNQIFQRFMLLIHILGDPRQAASCYKKAIDADKSVLIYHWTRCNLLEEIDEKQKALQGYRRLLLCLGSQQGDEYLKVFKY